MDKRLDWYLYTPPDVWTLMRALGLLQAVASEFPNFFAAMSLTQMERQVELFILTHRALWGEMDHDDHSDC